MEQINGGHKTSYIFSSFQGYGRGLNRNSIKGTLSSEPNQTFHFNSKQPLTDCSFFCFQTICSPYNTFVRAAALFVAKQQIYCWRDSKLFVDLFSIANNFFFKLTGYLVAVLIQQCSQTILSYAFANFGHTTQFI